LEEVAREGVFQEGVRRRRNVGRARTFEEVENRFHKFWLFVLCASSFVSVEPASNVVQALIAPESARSARVYALEQSVLIAVEQV
jgi:hypothetical protein